MDAKDKKKILEQVKSAKANSLFLANTATQQRSQVLSLLKEEILRNKERIAEVNRKDVVLAKEAGRSSAYLDRLALSEKRILRMAESLSAVESLPDPLNKILWETTRPNGLLVRKVSVPIGVIAIIYESRPDVTIESAGLCLKSGNAVILKGGSDSLSTNAFLVELMQGVLKDAGIPEEVVGLITSREHSAVDYLLSLFDYINLVIPRGGESLIELVVEKSKIPVVKHYKGVCHTYVDRAANLEMAWEVTLNAKTQRPGTCNATETLLVHRDIAEEFLPEMARRLKEKGVEMRVCPETGKMVPESVPAREKDWGFEFLDRVIAIKVVGSLEEAIVWVNRYGTGHSEAIITEDKESASRFLKEVDAAAVYHNASTRFTDGFEFGLGAEIGISTDKIHARGPMGLQELTSYKYLIYGNGQLRQ
ncbi:MAG: glutamate-5-semialdehyde dehydrogenase [Candidatus Omnitrophota bacterium]